MEERFVIYQITNLTNGKIFRASQRGKLINMFPRNKEIRNDIKKLGKDKFKWEILAECSNPEEFKKEKERLMGIEYKKRENNYNKDLLGYINVFDESGKILRIKNDHPKYLDGTYKYFSKGKFAAKNKNGQIEYISREDLRYLNGDFFGIAKGKVSVKDPNGNKIQVSVNDPKYLNGELIFISEGTKYSEEGIKNVKESQSKRRILERNKKFGNFLFDIESIPDERIFLIKNYCKHGDLKIDQRKFQKIYDSKSDIKIYCESCLDDFIKTVKVSDDEYQKYGKLLNKLIDNKNSYFFYPEIFKFIDPIFYKAIISFTDENLNYIEKIFRLRKGVQESPICLEKGCQNKTRYSPGNKKYNLYCDEHILNNYSSSGETEIYDYIRSLLGEDYEILRRDRSGMGKEIDIFIPKLKIGIEYNGLFWHSELNLLEAEYHQNKLETARKNGIDLIFIWEDEWNNKKEIVKNILKTKLNKLSNRINSSECTIKEISDREADQFLEENHIRGQEDSSFRLGLFYGNEIVSLMTFRKEPEESETLELIRFCILGDYLIDEAYEKLLLYFISNYKYKKIFTYSDFYSEYDEINKKIGFIKSNYHSLNYWWTDFSKRYEVLPKIDNSIFYKIWGTEKIKFEYINKLD